MREASLSDRFYRLLSDMKLPDRWFLRGPVGPGGTEIDPRDFTECRPLDVAGPLRIPLRRKGVELGFTLADFGMPVVWRSVVDALAELDPGAFQRFPVTVEGSGGEFDIVNVLAKVLCLDESRSEVSYFTEADGRPDLVGQYNMVLNLHVDPEVIGDHHLFRIDGWEVAIIVSEAAKRILERAKGAVFEPVT